jgi:3-methyladenine DNA glycosylase/8-oxoguanine DNA glycosylase
MTWSAQIPLVGAGGEPVDFARTVLSHGVASLPPAFIDEATPSLEITLVVPSGGVRTVVLTDGSGVAVARAVGRAPGSDAAAHIVDAIRHLLRLDEDLSAFYALLAADPELAWAAAGAGRMIRSQTVFEEVVKTICTTNCTWSATERMVGALVEHLGAKAPGALPRGSRGRAFPAPEAMAAAPEDFYRDVARAGYRGRYLKALAESVAAGEVDLEALAAAPREEVGDDEMETALLALPGVGPYAAAHIMLMLGRYSRLILDSWTRPTFLKVSGMKRAKDSTIRRRFGRHGSFAGLAFWLYLTRDWVND